MTAPDITIIVVGLVCLGGLYLAFKAPSSGRSRSRLDEQGEGRAGTRGHDDQSTTGAGAASRSSQDDYEERERSRMPTELVTAQLVTSERTFFRKGPRAFYAKVDQGFRTTDNRLVLVETKNRTRVTTSDIVQLTAQAIAIQSEVGNKLGRVAGYAYVRLQLAGGKPVYRRHGLYAVETIDQLVDTYHALRERRRYPLARPHPSRCGSCAFNISCRRARVQAGRGKTPRLQPTQ